TASTPDQIESKPVARNEFVQTATEMSVECGQPDQRWGGSIGAYERDGNTIRVFSDKCLLKTQGASIDRLFKVRTFTEPWRVAVERHSNGRLAGLILPI